MNAHRLSGSIEAASPKHPLRWGIGIIFSAPCTLRCGGSPRLPDALATAAPKGARDDAPREGKHAVPDARSRPSAGSTGAPSASSPHLGIGFDNVCQSLML